MKISGIMMCNVMHHISCKYLPARGLLRMAVAFAVFIAVISFAYGQLHSYERTFVQSVGPELNVKALLKDHDDFLWVGTSNGLYRFDGLNFELLGDGYNRHFALQHQRVSALFEDSRGNIWIGTPQGIHVLTAGRDKILFVPLMHMEKSGVRVPIAFAEIGNDIWVADNSNTVRKFKLPGDATDSIETTGAFSLDHWNMNQLLQLKSGDIIVGYGNPHFQLIDTAGNTIAEHTTPIKYERFYQEANGDVYCVSSHGVYKVDIYHNVFTQEYSFEGILGQPSSTWSCAFPGDSLRGMWIGSTVGDLMKYDLFTGKLEDLSGVLRNRIFDERFFANYAGIAGGGNALWLGTSQGLVYLYQPLQDYFETLPLPDQVEKLRDFSIRGITELRDGSIFVGSYSGMFRYFEDGRIRQYKIPNTTNPSGTNPLAYDFFPDGNVIWIASEGNSLVRYNYTTDSLHRMIPEVFFDTIQSKEISKSMWLTSVYRSHEGKLWLGSVNGLFYLNSSGYPSIMHVDEGHPLNNARIFHIAESPDSALWIGCDVGLFSLSEERSGIQEHHVSEMINVTVPHFVFNEDGTMWLATLGEGIKLYDPKSGNVEGYSSVQGLPDNSVYAIQKLPDNILWISTNNGLARFNPDNKVFTSFKIQDGLPDNEFNHNAFLQDSRGRLYFGGVGGVTRFHPGFIDPSGKQKALRATKISWHDGKVGETKYRVFSANIRPRIRLSPKDKYFTVFYGSRDVRPGLKQNSEYRLLGLHSDWQLNGKQNYVQFTNLKPGAYELQIRSVLEMHGSESPILSIPVYVERPLGKTWWAYTLYGLAIVGLGFVLFREYFARLHMRNRLKLELEHTEKLEEINRSKSTFFANITHEFKTPLTLINGPAEKIASHSSEPRIKEYANMITKNANAILRLVTQLLDLTKLEANLEEAHFYRIELVQKFKGWVRNFELLAGQKHIHLSTHVETPSLYLDCDPVKIETVCNNLLSNAIKFTPQGGEVNAELRLIFNSEGKPEAEISVVDTGPGIEDEEQQRIFERFYQGKHSVLGGTGIGLAFVRELIRLHNGVVELDSQPGAGSRFTIRIPVHQQHVKAGHMPSPGAEYAVQKSTGEGLGIFSNAHRLDNGKNEKAQILIAEDHADIAMLISETLSPYYHVKIAGNGKEAHEEAVKDIPDLLITDVMMPVLDGFRLTQLMKNDIHTSHIPIIMLTAKDGQESRLEGRMHGADLYLNKPFSPKELLLSVRNLLSLRDNLIQYASQDVKADVKAVKLSTDMDKAFYARFLTELENRLEDSDLSVSDMLEAMHMSRTQLHRKLKAITGQPFSEIVRSARLQKALSLLRHSGMNVTEVAYAVGYNTPSYFSESFSEYFGYPPSQARN